MLNLIGRGEGLGDGVCVGVAAAEPLCDSLAAIAGLGEPLCDSLAAIAGLGELLCDREPSDAVGDSKTDVLKSSEAVGDPVQLAEEVVVSDVDKVEDTLAVGEPEAD